MASMFVILLAPDDCITKKANTQTNSKREEYEERIRDFNRNELLPALNYKWYNISPPDWSHLSSQKLRNLQKLASLLVQELKDNEEPVVVDDGYFGLLLDFWKDTLYKYDFILTAVCLPGSPASLVPDSAQGIRDHAEHSIYMWTNYWITVLRSLSKTHHAFIDQSIESDSIAETLSRRIPRLKVTSYVANRVAEWLLRRANDSHNEEPGNEILPEVTKELRAEIRRRADSTGNSINNETIKEHSNGYYINKSLMGNQDYYLSKLLESKEEIRILRAAISGYQDYHRGVGRRLDSCIGTKASTTLPPDLMLGEHETTRAYGEEDWSSPNSYIKEYQLYESLSSVVVSSKYTRHQSGSLVVYQEVPADDQAKWQESYKQVANSRLSVSTAESNPSHIVLGPTKILEHSYFNADIIEAVIDEETLIVISRGDDPSIILPDIRLFAGVATVDIDLEIPGERLIQIYYCENTFDEFVEQKSNKVVLPAGRHQINWMLPIGFSGKLRLDPGNGPGKYKIFSIRITEVDCHILRQ